MLQNYHEFIIVERRDHACTDAQLVTRSHAWEPSIRDSYAKMRVARSRRKSSIAKSDGLTLQTLAAESEGESDPTHERLLDEGTAAWLVRLGNVWSLLYHFSIIRAAVTVLGADSSVPVQIITSFYHEVSK